MLDIEKRMKKYQVDQHLTDNLPVIVWLDGRAFHTLTRGMEKPDSRIEAMMDYVAMALCSDAANAKLAYIQSDEISLLLCKNDPFGTNWFDNRKSKIESVSASMASATATQFYDKEIKPDGPLVMFDSIAFVMPFHDVENFFIWRQMDWERNCLNMLCQNYCSSKELEGKNREELKELLRLNGKRWELLPPRLTRGRCVIRQNGKWSVDNYVPNFANGRNYIRRLIDWSTNVQTAEQS